MRLIEMLLGVPRIDPVGALLAVGASVLYSYLTRPQFRLDMDAWRQNGSFAGIDMLCAIGAQHEAGAFVCGSCGRSLPIDSECGGGLCHECGCGAYP